MDDFGNYMKALELAMRFHEAYERLAPRFGYETRAETREFDPQTPNGRLMLAVCREIIEQNATAHVRAVASNVQQIVDNSGGDQ